MATLGTEESGNCREVVISVGLTVLTKLQINLYKTNKEN